MKRFLLAFFLVFSFFCYGSDLSDGYLVAQKSSHDAFVFMPVVGVDAGYSQILSAHVGAFLGVGRLNKFVDDEFGTSISDIGVYEIDVTGAMADLEVGFDGVRASLGMFKMKGYTLFWILPMYGHQGLSLDYFHTWNEDKPDYCGINYELGVMNSIRMTCGIEKSVDSFGDGFFDGMRARLTVGYSLPVGLTISPID